MRKRKLAWINCFVISFIKKTGLNDTYEGHVAVRRFAAAISLWICCWSCHWRAEKKSKEEVWLLVTWNFKVIPTWSPYCVDPQPSSYSFHLTPPRSSTRLHLTKNCCSNYWLYCYCCYDIFPMIAQEPSLEWSRMTSGSCLRKLMMELHQKRTEGNDIHSWLTI